LLRLLATPRAAPISLHGSLGRRACSSKNSARAGRRAGQSTSKKQTQQQSRRKNRGTTPPQKNPLPFARRGPPSNTALPRSTPRSSSSRSSDGARTFAQLHRKVPIGYSGAHHICPQKLPVPVDRSPNPNYMPHEIAGVENAGKQNAGNDLSRNQDILFVTNLPSVGVIQSRQLVRLRRTERCDKLTLQYSI